jgi:hypothetical protein
LKHLLKHLLKRCNRPLLCFSLLALVLLTSACGEAGSTRYPHHPGLPTEGEARDAYFNTPLIVDDQGRALQRGMSDHAIFAQFEGRPAISYRSGRLTCFIYPIADTERWDRYGSPVASEWDLCFRAGKLIEKHRRK